MILTQENSSMLDTNGRSAVIAQQLRAVIQPDCTGQEHQARINLFSELYRGINSIKLSFEVASRSPEQRGSVRISSANRNSVLTEIQSVRLFCTFMYRVLFPELPQMELGSSHPHYCNAFDARTKCLAGVRQACIDLEEKVKKYCVISGVTPEEIQRYDQGVRDIIAELERKEERAADRDEAQQRNIRVLQEKLDAANNYLYWLTPVALTSGTLAIIATVAWILAPGPTLLATAVISPSVLGGTAIATGTVAASASLRLAFGENIEMQVKVLELLIGLEKNDSLGYLEQGLEIRLRDESDSSEVGSELVSLLSDGAAMTSDYSNFTGTIFDSERRAAVSPAENITQAERPTPSGCN